MRKVADIVPQAAVGRKTQSVIIHCDGCCEPTNPGGYGCWAWVAYDAAGGELTHGRGCLGRHRGMTNNQAEYAAVIQALSWAQKQGLHGVHILTDSQLVVNQAGGKWQVGELLAPLCADARRLLAAIDGSLAWHGREANRRADALSRLAYAEARGVPC